MTIDDYYKEKLEILDAFRSYWKSKEGTPEFPKELEDLWAWDEQFEAYFISRIS